MRTIKFRGISERTGEFVYGYYVPTCPMSSNPGIVDDEFVHEVKSESVAQLVGYDADGEEVYEGDVLIGEHGDEWEGVLRRTVTLPQYYDDSPFIGTGLKLKEARHD